MVDPFFEGFTIIGFYSQLLLMYHPGVFPLYEVFRYIGSCGFPNIWGFITVRYTIYTS